MKSRTSGQSMLEYMLLLSLAAFLVFMALRPGGVMEQTQTASQNLFRDGAEDITGVDFSCDPSCLEVACGGVNECGGKCWTGSCPTGQSCQGGSCKSTCSPNCSGAQCGDPDGCLGYCWQGECPLGESCQRGSCESTCSPNCSGKSCGDDDECDGKCIVETCRIGYHCNDAGSCECTPSCSGKRCGADNGCGTPCNTGTCDNPKRCYFGECQPCLPGTPNCVGKDCGEFDGCASFCTCPLGQTCVDGDCQRDSGSGQDDTLSATSSAFQSGVIPVEYSANGGNTPVPVTISGVPENAASLVLVMRDLDAGNFVHWFVYDIPPTATSIDLNNV